ncbi:MAG: type IV secretion system DotC family protein [Gammaproteobacteria bacterium]|nr:type IV secretion system DotC family protein [Gammaproteobacteria bacterium]
MKKIIFFYCLLSFTLAGCAARVRPVDTENLQDLQNINYGNLRPAQPSVGHIRKQALQDVAMSTGAQSGLAWRYQQINTMLSQHTDALSQVFNFNPLLIDQNILPPVLDESSASLNLQDADTILIADHTYRIIKQARFVTLAPTWRDYLIMDYKKPELPDQTLLPKTIEERQIWKKYITLGWKNGLEQANAIYEDNLARLRRDYEGMMLYRELLSKHMVSKPFVAQTNMGVTSNDAHTEMRINDRVLRITALPKLQVNSSHWKPVVVQKNE